MNHPSFSTHNKVTLVKNGEEFIQANLELINEAKTFIWLHTYIYEDDATTKVITDALKKKAQAGVNIYFLVDGFGSRSLSNRFIEELKFAGVEFNWFSPLFSSKLHHIGRRLHSKMLLVDNLKVLTGGINHSKRFIAPDGEKPWLDYSVILEGEGAFEFMQQNYKLYSKHFISIRQLRALYFYVPMKLPSNYCLTRLLKNDWMRFKNQIFKSHIENIRTAKKQITIIATYFFPGKKLLNELKLASKRGVQVTLIFTERSDHPIERWSSRYLYSWFLKQNFKIYEWKESIVHGKVMVFDDKSVSLGSYNNNFMSRYGNIELNLEIVDYQFNHIMSEELKRVTTQCNLITQKKWNDSQLPIHQLKSTLSYFFANFLSVISIWLATRKDENEDFNLSDQ